MEYQISYFIFCQIKIILFFIILIVLLCMVKIGMLNIHVSLCLFQFYNVRLMKKIVVLSCLVGNFKDYIVLDYLFSIFFLFLFLIFWLHVSLVFFCIFKFDGEIRLKRPKGILLRKLKFYIWFLKDIFFRKFIIRNKIYKMDKNCPGFHNPKVFRIDHAGYSCDSFLKHELEKGTLVYGCRICNWDVCLNCWFAPICP